MKNRRAKGNYYKHKTKKYFEKLGYQVFNCETGKAVFFGGRLRMVRQDLCGADLLALGGPDKEIIFIQSKTNKSDISTGKKEFAKYQFPSFVKRWVVIWPIRAKEPVIHKI